MELPTALREKQGEGVFMNVCFVPGKEEESITTECTLFLLSPTGPALLPCTLLPNRHLWSINSATQRN